MCEIRNKSKVTLNKLLWKVRQMKDGSYTVEASFILCFIICVMLGMIYIGFYIHDCHMASIVMIDCIKKENRFIIECSDQVDGTIIWDEWAKRSILWRLFYKNNDQKLEQRVKDQLKGKLFISDIRQVHADVQVGTITLKYEMNIFFPDRWMEAILNKRMISVCNEIKIEEKESEELIRLCRGIKE